MGFLFRLASSSVAASATGGKRLLSRALHATSSSVGRLLRPHGDPACVARPVGAGGGGRDEGRASFWAGSLLPLALAASAGALALGLPPSAALCDAGPGVSAVGKEVLVQGAYREVPKELIDELSAICKNNMTLDYEERYFHGKPQNSFHKAVNVPDVVVYPRSQDDVVKIVTSCNKYKVPIVPYGGATSIEGHTLAPSGGVCIDMTFMNKIKALHIEDMDVVVEPGIGWIELNEYLKPYGLFFPLDPDGTKEGRY